MIINEPDNDNDVLKQIAERLREFEFPFMIVTDIGDHKLNACSNLDKFENGHINMAKALEAIAHDLRKREDG